MASLNNFRHFIYKKYVMAIYSKGETILHKKLQNGFFQHENREAKRRNFDLLLAKRRNHHLKYPFLVIFTTFPVFKHKIYTIYIFYYILLYL